MEFSKLSENIQNNIRRIAFISIKRLMDLTEVYKGISSSSEAKQLYLAEVRNENLVKLNSIVLDITIITFLWDSSNDEIKRNCSWMNKYTAMLSDIKVYSELETHKITSVNDLLNSCSMYNTYCKSNATEMDRVLSELRNIPIEPVNPVDTTTDNGDMFEGLTGLMDDDDDIDNIEPTGVEETGTTNIDEYGIGDSDDDDDYGILDNVETTSSVENTENADDVNTSENVENISTVNENTEDDEEEDFMDSELVGSVYRVMNVMRDLYEVGFDLRKPHGVLCKDGLLYIKNRTSKVHADKSLSLVYQILNNLSGGYIVQSEVETDKSHDKLREITMRRGTTYYPEYHLGNAMGITSGGMIGDWKTLEGVLRREVTKVIKHEIERGIDVADIVDSLTTCVVVTELEPMSCIKFRIAIAGNKVNSSMFRAAYNKHARQLFGGVGDLQRCEALDSGVLEVTIVTDSVAFNGKPLFAYEAVRALLDTGRTPSIRNTIIGQDSSGKIMTTDLTKQQHCITLIGAGQRSGKGVLTLNLLGSILSSGSPLVYLDSKPDMSVTIRELASRYGIEAAVWDSVQTFGNKTGVGAPAEIRNTMSGIFGKLMYLKVVQMMMVVAHLSMLGNKLFDTTPFFIFDEVLAFQQTIKSDWGKLATGAKEKNEDANTAWCKKVEKWGETLQGDLAGTVNSQLPASGVCTIWLFQAMQSMFWTAQGAKGVKTTFNPFKDIVGSRISTKLLGRGTFDTENGLSKLKDDSEVKNKIENRWFAQSTAQKIGGREEIKMFKPYLVLNTANNGDSCVEEFRKNVGEAVWKKVAPDGTLDPGAGFEGFINLLGQGAVNNLVKGRELLEKVMQVTGLSQKYSRIEDYIYDASVDSFFDLAQLVNGNVFSSGTDMFDDDEDEDYHIQLGGLGVPSDNTNKDGDYIPDIEPNPLGGVNTQGGTPSGVGGAQYGGTFTPRQEPVTNGTNSGTVFGGSTTTTVTDVPVDNVVEQIKNTGITEEQLVQILNILQKTPVKSSVDNKGYVRTTETNPEYAVPLERGQFIDCSDSSRVKLNPLESLLEMRGGSEVYIDKMFKTILEDASAGFRSKSLISKVGFVGGNMYINGMIVNLNGVLGGRENITLEQIIDFEILFKKYKNLRELDLDTDTLALAMMQCGSSNPYDIFNLSSKLVKINIFGSAGTETIVRGGNGVGRMASDGNKKAQAQAIGDTYRKVTWGDSWQSATRGSKVWGAQAAKSSLRYAGKALGGDKVKPLRGIGAAIWGAGVGTVGAVSWFGWSLVKSAKNFIGGK